MLKKEKTTASFNGVPVSQTVGIQKYFEEIIPDFDRIIEIGTYSGGLTLFIHSLMNRNCELISYDINAAYNKVPSEYSLDFRIGDCFDPFIQLEIADLIGDKTKRVLVLCDGGKKNEEFNTFSKFLKPDDVIMCHDYSETIEEFNKFKKLEGWGGIPESDYASIANSILSVGLTGYHYEEFKSVFWGSFVKK